MVTDNVIVVTSIQEPGVKHVSVKMESALVPSANAIQGGKVRQHFT